MNELTNEFLTQRRKSDRALLGLARTPVIYDPEEARIFNDGLEKLITLSFEERRQIADMDVKDVAKMTGLDENVKKAIGIIERSLGAVSDAITGAPNSLLKRMADMERKAKALHTEQVSMVESYVLEVSTMRESLNEQYIDSGFLGAYRFISTDSARSIKMRDIFMDFRFQELGHNEEADAISMAGETDEEISVRRFGAAARLNEWDQKFQLVSANEILALIRIAALKLYTWVAYKSLFIGGERYKPQSMIEVEENATAADIFKAEIFNANHTLNLGYEYLIRNAGNIPESPADGGPTGGPEAALPVSMQTAVLGFYNPVHESFVRQMRSVTLGNALRGDGMVVDMYQPVIFAPTPLAPLSGQWDLVDGGNKQRDAWGAFGKVQEAAGKSAPAIRLVIPGLHNIGARFQGLQIGTDRQASKEAMVISAHERYNFHVEERQVLTVELRGAKSATKKTTKG